MPATPSYWAASLAAATFPLGGLALMAMEPASPSKAQSGPAAKDKRGHPFATLAEHVGIQIASAPRYLLTYAISEYTLGDWRSTARTLDWSWVLPIFARNVLLVLVVCSVWDGALLGLCRARMAPHKFNPAYPALFARRQTSPIARDAAWTCVSACVAAAYEVCLRQAWATGRLAYATVPGAAPGTDGAWWAHWPTLAWMATWFYWQNIQFYAMHRAMHRWGTTAVPDVGAWLYKHVHSLHHEARNPTAFSGLAMHPVESAAFLSVALLPAACGAHPVVFLYLIVNLLVSPPIGHSGFEEPGGGSQAHWLHHSLVDCNYAENVLPMDWLCGTFAADEADAAASMERRRLRRQQRGGKKGE